MYSLSSGYPTRSLSAPSPRSTPHPTVRRNNRWAHRGRFGQADHTGARPGEIIVTFLIGRIGAVVGDFIVQALLGLHGGGFIWSILVATVGAIILLALYRLIVGQRGT